MKKQYFGILLFILLALPPIANGLESLMLTHMLVQIPLLIFSGFLIGKGLLTKYGHFFNAFNHNGIPGILLVVFVVLFWMLPRSLDGAINYWYMEVFKYSSLPILVGIPLADSWQKLTGLWKTFIVLNIISMFGLLGWLYIEAPIRLCNNYLEYQQKQLGWGFLVITGILLLTILERAFLGKNVE